MIRFLPYSQKWGSYKKLFQCPKSCCAHDNSKLLNIFRLFFTCGVLGKRIYCTDLKYSIWNTYVHIIAQFSQKECWQSQVHVFKFQKNCLFFGKNDLKWVWLHCTIKKKKKYHLWTKLPNQIKLTAVYKRKPKTF